MRSGLPGRLVLAAAVVSVASFAFAQDRYAVKLTRKDSNFYKVDGTKVWVQTRYCHEYGYGEEAALNSYEVIFLGSGTNCVVRRVLSEADAPPGTYRLSLTYEDDNLYSSLSGTYVRTSMCMHLGVGSEAVLRLRGYGMGDLTFLERGAGRCQVEGVYSKIRL